MRGEIFTLGHGSRSLSDLVELLDTYDITLLVDVRSKPFSRFNPEVGRPRLEQALGERYTWIGNTLGGLREEKAPDWKEGLLRLLEFREKGNICVMCSEINPSKCHREYWIARDLRAMGEKVTHILSDGSVQVGQQVTL